MKREWLGIIVGLATVAAIIVLVYGVDSGSAAGDVKLDFTALPSPINQFDGAMPSDHTGNSMVVYKGMMYVSWVDYATGQGHARVTTLDDSGFHPLDFFWDAQVSIDGSRYYTLLGVVGNTLYISRNTGMLWRYSGDGSQSSQGDIVFNFAPTYCTYVTQFSSDYYYGCANGAVYRGTYSTISTLVYTASSHGMITGLTPFKNMIYGTATAALGSDSILFSSGTGNLNSWDEVNIAKGPATLCGKTSDYLSIMTYYRSGTPLMVTSQIRHYSDSSIYVTISSRTGWYKQYMDTFYLEDVEYVFYKTTREMLPRAYGAQVCVNDTSGTDTQDTGGDLIYACAMPSNYLYIITTYYENTDYARDAYYVYKIPADVWLPELLSDDTPSSATTGDALVFNVDTKDAWGIDAVTVDHWTDDAPTPASLSLSLRAGTVNEGRWGAEITVASGSTSPIHYNVTLRDVNKLESKAATRTVSVSDNDPPVLGTDTSPDAGTTGDAFDFSVTVLDNIGVSEVHVEYWFGGVTHTNRSLAGTDPYQLQITIPSASTDALNYFLSAVDTAGNWAKLSDVTVPISDNDPPHVSVTSVPAEGTTGDKVVVHPAITDNVGVVNAYVEYWFGAGGHFNVTLSSTDDYTVSIDLPGTSTDALQFFVSAVDAEDLWYKTDTMSVPIRDDDGPTFGTDATPTGTHPGETLTFSVVVSDNIGVALVNVTYWFGSGAHTEKTMGGIGTYTYEITVPDDATEPLTYQFSAVDGAGNMQTTTEREVPVADDVLPVLGADASDAVAVNGHGFTFKVTASDNIGVAEVKVKYKWGTDAYQEQAMVGNGTFTFALTIPASESRVLTYMFVATDPSGNTASSQEYTRTPVDRTVPVLGKDASEKTAKAGKEYKFDVTWQDNKGVVGVYVLYWYEGQLPTNVSMVLVGGNYTYTMTVPSGAKGTLYYEFKAKDAAGNWAQTPDYQLEVTKKEEEKGGLSMTLLAVVIIIIILVVVLWLVMSRRKGPATAPASAPTLEAAVPPSPPSGPQGGMATVQAPVAAPPAPPVAVAAPAGVAMATGGKGSFTRINTRISCSACGSVMERGTSAYVCSCGTAIHEKCAGQAKVCPSCKSSIRI